MTEGRLPLRLRIAWTIRSRTKDAAIKTACAVACLLAMAATTKAAFDLLRWRDAGSIARAVAEDRSLSVEERINAIVVMQRDIREGARLLQQLRSEGGQIQHHADNALVSIAEQLGK